MFILTVQYGLVHRGNCINCGTCNLCFDLAFVWPSIGFTNFHSASLANPFRFFVCVPELAGDARKYSASAARSYFRGSNLVTFLGGVISYNLLELVLLY